MMMTDLTLKHNFLKTTVF